MSKTRLSWGIASITVLLIVFSVFFSREYFENCVRHSQITEIDVKESYSEKQMRKSREYLLSRNYVQALDYLLVIEKKFKNDKELLLKTIFVRIYLNVMTNQTEEALSLAEELTDKHGFCFIETIMRLREGEPEKVIEIIDRTQRQRDAANDPSETITALYFRSLACFALCNYEDALDNHHQLLQIIEKNPEYLAFYADYIEMISKIQDSPNDYLLVLKKEELPPPRISSNDFEKVDLWITYGFEIKRKFDNKAIFSFSGRFP